MRTGARFANGAIRNRLADGMSVPITKAEVRDATNNRRLCFWNNAYGDMSYADIKALAQGARGTDEDGYRAEFMQLLNSAEIIDQRN